MKNKIVSLILSLVFIFAAIAVIPSANAIVTVDEGDYSFAVNGQGTYILYKYNGSDTVLELPDSVYGCPVMGIYSNCFAEKNITSVKLPEGYTYIGNSAFLNCASLTSIELSATINKIEAYAFAGCTALEEIDFSATQLTALPESLCLGDSALADVRLPEQLYEIGDRAFAYCPSLNAAAFPESMVIIGREAFRNSSVDGMYLRRSIKSIGEKAFISTSGTLIFAEKSYGETYCTDNAMTNCRVRLLGDIDNSGTVTVMDATLMQKYAIGTYRIDDLPAVECADVSGDGSFGIRDATLIQMWVAGIIVSFW